VLGLTFVESGEGEDMAGSVPVAIDRHKNLLTLVVFHFQDQPAEGGTIVGGLGDRGIQLDEVLGTGSAQAARDVALSVISRKEGVAFLIGGVEPEDVHQAEGEVGVGGEVGEAEDSTDHGLGCGLIVSFTVDVSHSETRVAGPASRGRCCGGGSSRFSLLLAIP